MKEEIRMIPFTNGRYGVSNIGNVYSYYYYNKKLIEPQLLNTKLSGGYKQVRIRINHEESLYYVHRLVAIVFIPNPDRLPQVNHKNEIKLDNRVENLEWCDAYYNNHYGNHNKRVSEKNALRRIPIVQYDINGRIIKKFESIKDARQYFHLNHSQITEMITGKRPNKYNLHYI